ncbi:MAG: urea ABC transporter ATP-binding protein UrtD [Caldilineaceae bacterium]
MEQHTILDIQNLNVIFDGFRALDDLDFAMNHGELRFVIGPNGAGKTTLLDVITGKTRPTSGKVTFDGKIDIRRTPEHQLVRKGIGRKFQTPTVFGSLTVYENLEAAAGFKHSTLGLLSALPSADKAQVDHILELVNLVGRAHVRAGILAHGERQWLEIGMMLVQQPKLLLLDEPVAGMTRSERNRTGELLQRIAEFCSVLVVEHDMEFLRSFANTVTVLHMGKLLTQGPVTQVQSDPKVIEVYLGRGHKR